MNIPLMGISLFLFYFNFFNVYLIVGEREKASWGGAERERERGYKAGSMPSVQSQIRDSNPQTVRS